MTYQTTKGGQLEVLLDFNNNGVYDLATSDRIIVDQKPAGIHCLSWDELDGLGSLVASGSLSMSLKYQAGVIHMPLGDVEDNFNGFERTLVRPSYPSLTPGRIYWDNSASTGGNTSSDFTGVTSAGNPWGNGATAAPNPGDLQYMNTWFSFAEITQTLSVSIVTCDVDNDQILDNLDLDDDNDGIRDIVEIYTGDHDGDLTLDYEDPEFCADTYEGVNGWSCTNGLPDPNADLDGDGLPNYQDPSFPNCSGVSFGACANYDTDSDGVPNHLDLDSDNDGIADLIEAGGIDRNGDGRVAMVFDGVDRFLDADEDGIKDAGETTVIDTDDDGWFDPYDNASGSVTSGSPLAFSDFDGDGLPNYRDIDADNDGIVDLLEGGGSENNTDGRVNIVLDASRFYVDTDGDGVKDAGETTLADADGDGLFDAYDPDDDGTAGIDAGESLQPLFFTYPDINADYKSDDNEGFFAGSGFPVNFDETGNPNYLDIDADNDGIVDNVEGQSTTGYIAPVAFADTDKDGLRNEYDPTDGGTFIDPENTDLAELPDYLDLNADNDPQNDAVEGHDTDNDGIPDSGSISDTGVYTSADADGDGLHDDYDNNDASITDVANGTTPLDHPNLDIAGTVQRDWREGNAFDKDGDGIDDIVDIDDDNDGIPDVAEVCGPGAVDFACQPSSTDPSADTDGDLVPNHSDADYCTLNGFGVCADLDRDTDGIIDQFDLDADDDGIPDVIEAGGVDTDGNGIVDYIGTFAANDSDNDGLVNTYDGTTGGNPIPNHDSDGNGIADAQDLDSDDDGTPDIIEAGGTDTNGDGISDNRFSQDNDGYSDVYDPDDDGIAGTDAGESTDPLLTTGTDTGNGTPASYPATADADGDLIPNARDRDSDNDGITDVVENGGADSNGDGVTDGYTDSDSDGYTDKFDPDTDGFFGSENPSKPLTVTTTDGNGNNRRDLTERVVPAESVGNQRDIDGDYRPNFLDLDAENDGIPDLTEMGGADNDNNGIADNLTDADNDGYADIYDSDDDNNGTTDGGAANQPLMLTIADGNADGKISTADGTVAALYPAETSSDQRPGDLDRDGIINAYDPDADGDGITDPMDINGGEMPAGHTNQGIVITLTDANDNGWQDALEGASVILDPANDADADGLADEGYLVADDFDSDRLPNAYDIDADNDGILDADEVQLSNSTDLPGGTDTDQDGIDNAFDPDNGGNPVTSPANIDGVANTPDFLDLDTDNDGSRDWVEGFDSSDPDTDAVSEYLTKMNDWRSAFCPGVAHCAVYDNSVDADADGYPAWVDANDASAAIAGGNDYLPPFIDASNATYFFDSDKDGLVDLYDLPAGGASTEPALGISSVSVQAPAASTALTPDYRNTIPAVTFPVEWLSFEAVQQGNTVQLSWATGSEINTDQFVIERSESGLDFEQIGTKAAQGQSSGVHQYTFADLQAVARFSGTVYYRIRQVDAGGAFSFSDTREVVLQPAQAMAQVLVNPVDETLEVLVFTTGNGTLSLLNPLGQSVQQATFVLNTTGSTLVRMDVSALSQGIYLLQVVAGKQIESYPVLIR